MLTCPLVPNCITAIVYSTHTVWAHRRRLTLRTKEGIGAWAALTMHPHFKSLLCQTPPLLPDDSFRSSPVVPPPSLSSVLLRRRDVSRHIPRLLSHGVGRPRETQPSQSRPPYSLIPGPSPLCHDLFPNKVCFFFLSSFTGRHLGARLGIGRRSFSRG